MGENRGVGCRGKEVVVKGVGSGDGGGKFG